MMKSSVGPSENPRSQHGHEPLPENAKSVDVGCNEMLVIPSFRSRTLQTFYNLRFKFIRFCTVPISCISHRVPIIGGRTVLELAIILVLFGVSINYVLRKVVPAEAGQVVADVAAVAIACGFKNNILTLVFGISYERALFWHKFGAVLWMTLGIIHGVRETPALSDLSRSRNTLGLTMMCLLGATSALYVVRYSVYKYPYEWFYFSHVLFFLAIVAVAYLHGATQVLYAACVWVADVVIRFILTMHRIKAKARLLPGDVVKISFPKSFEYSPGQFCFLLIPQVSAYQFHPFSCSSAPHEESISFHIRVLGDWTRNLQQYVMSQYAVQNKQADECVDIDLCLEGPLGNLAVDLNDSEYKVILLVAGGIGVTPTQSILNHLVYKYGVGSKTLNKCLMVWSVKDRAIIDHVDVASTLEKSIPRELPISFQPDLVQLTTIQDRVDMFESDPAADGTLHESDPAAGGALHAGSVEDSACLAGKTCLTAEELREKLASNKNLQNGVVFQGEFYLTSVRCEADFLAANIDLAKQPYLSFGRPVLAEIVGRVAKYCAADISERGSRVAVVVCGPPDMVSDLVDICTCDHQNIRFDVHCELFEL
jgi:predicted ferric reductase